MSQLTIYYLSFELILKTILVEQLIIIAKKYPSMFYFLGKLITIYGLCINIHNIYIEYKTVLRCMSFIMSIYFFDPTNLDLLTCL